MDAAKFHFVKTSSLSEVLFQRYFFSHVDKTQEQTDFGFSFCLCQTVCVKRAISQH